MSVGAIDPGVMGRASLLLAVLVVVGAVAVPAVDAVTQDERDDREEEPDVRPGERLSGVVGVQQAEFDGEIETNAYRIALENADDNATEAGHIAEKLEETDGRLAELEERKAELEEQRESGEISEGEYRAEIAELAVEGEALRDQLNRSSDAATDLPAETLEENGVNTSAIRALQQRADELTGQEVAEIARSIAGDERGEVARDDGGEAGDRYDRGADDERPDDDEQRGQQPDDEEDTDGGETPDDDGRSGNESGQD